MPTKTAAPEFYFPTLEHLQHHGATESDCDCDSHRKGHRTCKHMKAVKMYREEALLPINATTLAHHGRPFCQCDDFDRFGECVHVYALQQNAGEVARLEKLRSELIAEFG
jgi:hypothetical protein